MKLTNNILSVFTLQIIPKSPIFRQILVALGPLISTISLGMTSGFSAILLPQMPELTRSEQSWIAAMAALPLTFGCLLGGYLMQKLGRHKTQLISIIPSLIGWSLIGFSPNITLLLIGRFLTGLSGGIVGPSTGVYISETSSPKYRDFLLGAISLSVALGLFLVHLLGTFLTWKMTALLCSTLPVLSLTFLKLVPESPHWLLQNKSEMKGHDAWKWCRGDDEQSRIEWSTLIGKKHQNDNTCDVTSRSFLKPLFIISVFIVTNQLSGVNAVTFYTVTIIQKTVIDSFDPYIATLLVDLIRLFSSLLACYLMKKVKRRPLALISGVGTSISLLFLAIYIYLSLLPQITILPLTIYIFFISIGFVPLPWAMMGEVFPGNTRNIGSAISSFLGFLTFFIVVKLGPYMIEEFGIDCTFLFYGLAALTGTVFVWTVLPETQGRSLADLEGGNK